MYAYVHTHTHTQTHTHTNNDHSKDKDKDKDKLNNNHNKTCKRYTHLHTYIGKNALSLSNTHIKQTKTKLFSVLMSAPVCTSCVYTVLMCPKKQIYAMRV